MKSKYVLAMILAITLNLSTGLIYINSAMAADEDDVAIPVTALETTAEAAVLMDAFTGNILWSKEPEKELPMASVTKVMTMLLTCEALEQGKINLNDRIKTSENAWSMGGSQIYLEPGEEMILQDMLISIAVGSANDASVAVAEHIAGSVEAFVDQMNEKAEKLGCKHTHFANPTGLTAAKHYTSAHDMAVIFREALKHEQFRKDSSIYRYEIRGGDFVLWNTNKLLKLYQGVDAGKTGWTNEAKYCLAATAKRNDLRLISVVLGTSETRSHFRETIKLFNYGFASYEGIQFAKQDERLGTVPVDKGILGEVDAMAAADVAMAVPKGEKDKYSGKTVLPKEITAPVAKGQKIGDFVLMENGQEVQRVPLLAKSKVEKASLLRQVEKVLNEVF